jgi:hypothetical protein
VLHQDVIKALLEPQWIKAPYFRVGSAPDGFKISIFQRDELALKELQILRGYGNNNVLVQIISVVGASHNAKV